MIIYTHDIQFLMCILANFILKKYRYFYVLWFFYDYLNPAV